MNPQTHIVTGAAGFIGSHLCDALLARGHRVIGIDDLSLGTKRNIEAATATGRFSFCEADLNDDQAVASCMESNEARSTDTVWHLAANSDIQAGVADPEVDLRRTFMTTYSTLRLCRRLGIRKVAFASTSAVYGELAGPLAESSGPLFPISNYGAMKLASEAMLSAALTDCLDRLVIVRFPNVVGIRSTHGAIHDFIRRLRHDPSKLVVLGDGTQEKPYLHVTDLVAAMLYVYDHSPDKLSCFNIGDGATVTKVADIAKAVVSRVSPAAAIEYTGGRRGWAGDVPKFQYDTGRLQRLGWRPVLDSTAAVCRAVDELAETLL
jgi:UDP-glucose 4-epimerase